jgi:hypothetical protein
VDQLSASRRLRWRGARSSSARPRELRHCGCFKETELRGDAGGGCKLRIQGDFHATKNRSYHRNREDYRQCVEQSADGRSVWNWKVASIKQCRMGGTQVPPFLCWSDLVGQPPRLRINRELYPDYAPDYARTMPELCGGGDRAGACSRAGSLTRCQRQHHARDSAENHAHSDKNSDRPR